VLLAVHTLHLLFCGLNHPIPSTADQHMILASIHGLRRRFLNLRIRMTSPLLLGSSTHELIRQGWIVPRVSEIVSEIIQTFQDPLYPLPLPMNRAERRTTQTIRWSIADDQLAISPMGKDCITYCDFVLIRTQVVDDAHLACITNLYALYTYTYTVLIYSNLDNKFSYACLSNVIEMSTGGASSVIQKYRVGSG